MAAVLYYIFSSSALASLGLYHLISTTRTYLKFPHSYSAKPFHPFPSFSSSSSPSSRFKHLQLYLLIIFLLFALAHQFYISFISDPLLKGRTPVHLFSSIQSAALLFLFLILTVSLFVSDSSSVLPIPTDLFFALASALFFLQYSVSSSAASFQISDLQAKCDSLSARVSAIISFLCLLLAFNPRLFFADLGLGASICLKGLWVLQTGLSLYVDAFIPDGCHRLLDVADGVEGSTKCDVEESKFRAVAILDFLFLMHVTFVVLIAMVTYACIAKSIGIRKMGSYEALPTAASVSETNHSHVQMKTLTGTQA